MSWFILFIAGLLEVVWAVGLKYTHGFSRLVPSVITIVAMVLSMALLSWAMKTLPVGTAYAVKRAVIDGEPLTERVVTLTGESISRPGNVWARLGTPVRHLLNDAGFCPSADQMVIMGGPLMGFTLPWLDVPVVKITNCLLAPSASEMGETPEEKGCIRCSACADACPADLLPRRGTDFRGGDIT